MVVTNSENMFLSKILYAILFAVFFEIAIVETKISSDTNDIAAILSRIEILERESQSNKNLVTELQNIVKKQSKTIKDQEKELIWIKKVLAQDRPTSRQTRKPNNTKVFFQSLQRNNSNLKVDSGLTEVPTRKQRDFESVQRTTTDEITNTPRIDIRQVSPDAVAFFAILHEDLFDVPTGHIIKFGSIVRNYGNAYNGNDGIFVVPTSGLYLFHWRGMPPTGKTLYAALTVNGQGYEDIFADSTDHLNSGSEVALVHVSSGTHVWIEVGYSTSSFHRYHSTFSGVLLSAD